MTNILPTPSTPKKLSPSELLALIRAERAAKGAQVAALAAQSAPGVSVAPRPVVGSAMGSIVLNAQQQAFVTAASDLSNPTPVLLLGPAGTGKTTAIAALFRELFRTGACPTISWKHKYLPGQSIGAVVCAFTRRATNNIKKRLPEEIRDNALTIHKLLEYAPTQEELLDKATGKLRLTQVFRPMRDKLNKLPNLTLLIVEEVSMLGMLLEANIIDALPSDVKIVFVGDIAQLVPVMDTPAIAKYLLKIPTIELTEVYRQALESPIISLATDIRRGKTNVYKDLTVLTGAGSTVTIQPWKAKQDRATANKALGKFFELEYKAGKYIPEEHQILIPFHREGKDGGNVCAIELNRHIGTMRARAAGAEVHQVVAGFETKHFAVGDACIYDKADCTILSIKRNRVYLGKAAAQSSTTLDYWGYDPKARARYEAELASDDADHLLFMTSGASLKDEEGKEVRVTQASHMITLLLADTGQEVTLSSASQINNLDLAYAMTVHKAQGSEWEKVYLVVHDTHDISINRELLYTAITRAKKDLHVICNRDTFVTGVLKQAIKGDTLEAKAKFLQLRLKMAAMQVKTKRTTEEDY